MTNDQFEDQIQEMLARIYTLPEPSREHLLRMVEETRRRHAQIHDSVARARTALDDWRLLKRYLIFDAECRRRESQAGPDKRDDGTAG